jgi:hypothetical protein
MSIKGTESIININIKSFTNIIDNYIEEFYKNPVKTFDTNDAKKIDLVANMIENIVSKQSTKYEIEKYNKLILVNTDDGMGCIKKEYKIKKSLGKRTLWGVKRFITKNNKILIIKRLYFFQKNAVKKYDDIVQSYNTLYKANICPKLLDSYLCCNNEYNECYMVFVLDKPENYILLSEYVNKPSVKSKELEDIKEALYEMNKNLTKKNIVLSHMFEMEDVMISPKNVRDMKYIVLEDLTNLNDTIDYNLKNYKRILNHIIIKNGDNITVNDAENARIYVAKRLLDNNYIKIEL